jgi:predicted DNA-binding WGR domain protein
MDETMRRELPEIKLDALRPERDYSRVVLQMVDPRENHYKYYVMKQHEDKKTEDRFGNTRYAWTAIYGRIGKKPQRHDYDGMMGSYFEETLKAKIKKGYVPVFAEKWGNYQSELDRFFSEMGDDAWELE